MPTSADSSTAVSNPGFSPAPALSCAHCGRAISRWDSRDAEMVYGRAPLYVHDDLVDGTDDGWCSGVYCDEADEAEERVATPRPVTRAYSSSTCRRCGGPCADGSGLCGEC